MQRRRPERVLSPVRDTRDTVATTGCLRSLTPKNNMPLTHVVLFKLREDVTEQQRWTIYQAMMAMKTLPQIQSIDAGEGEGRRSAPVAVCWAPQRGLTCAGALVPHCAIGHWREALA